VRDRGIGRFRRRGGDTTLPTRVLISPRTATTATPVIVLRFRVVLWVACRDDGNAMNDEQDTVRTEEGDAAVARAALRKIGREERLLERAEGQLWLQCLPMLVLVVFGLLWFVEAIRPALLVVWFVAPILLIQLALWSNGRRIDALLDIVRSSKID